MEKVLVWAINGNLLTEEQIEKISKKCISERMDRISRRKGRAKTEAILAGRLLTLMKQKYDKYDSWKLEENTYGKPYWSTTKSESTLKFSISHTSNCAFLAISEGEIGVDLEKIAECRMNIAYRFFSKEESLELEKISGTEKNQLFFKMWTRKEAEGKLGGQGLRESLGQPIKNSVYGISDVIEIEKMEQEKFCISLCSNQEFSYEIEWIQG